MSISRTQAISIARSECERRQWAWLEPVKAQSGDKVWIIHTSWGYRGGNAKISIDRETGEVVKAAYLPR